eukprot:m.124467 g.124467  ORF g.124467 m.124467 type:complete len:611 (-) comp14472_c0_seq3:942-2774(-)
MQDMSRIPYNLHFIWAASLDNQRILPYNNDVHVKLERAWQQNKDVVNVQFGTVGGTFKYIMKLMQTDRTNVSSKQIAAGFQINSVSGTSRPIFRFNLIALGSPTGALWLYNKKPAEREGSYVHDESEEDMSDCTSVDEDNDADGDHGVYEGNDVVENNEVVDQDANQDANQEVKPNDEYLELFSPYVCVALERKLHAGRKQALILERNEQPYIIKFDEEGEHTKVNVVTSEVVKVKRREPLTIHREGSQQQKAPEQREAEEQVPQASLSITDGEEVMDTSEEKLEDKKLLEMFVLECTRRANKLYSRLTQVVYRAVSLSSSEDIVIPTKSELISFLLAQVDGVAKMVVKDKKTSVLDSIWAALADGVAGLSGPGALALARLSKMQLRYIFSILVREDRPVSAAVCKMHVETLVDSWVSCTAEQIRATDRLYGILSGREMSFPEQVLLALDRYKDLTLDKLTIWMASTVAKGHRFPHLQNRLRIELAAELGLSGVESAEQDQYIVPKLSHQSIQLASAKFYELFDTMDFIKSIVTDINTKNDSAERIVTTKALLEFAQEEQHNGFDQNMILYNEEEALYYEQKPVNEYDIYLHTGTALTLVDLALNKVKKH